ncbi:MBL fold metallo-hydrolase [Bacillus mycoides]|uniref:MBL fold metallo-hydrolase n=1 Tax=Bacillus mycoides TaxID=1405 RepID=UPI00187958F8|nr:MBL fold metallo-hydrolase [Bacillus mycoides]MBE7150060.1 MBL fold metallo-hydrolase [Bacillus mycoides]
MFQSVSYHHYVVKTLSEGVYAAIATFEGSAGSNSGILDLGNETLVFDTSSTLSAARELKEIAETLTGRHVTYVVNSHMHPDHIHGNAVFNDRSILISSSKTLKSIEKESNFRLESMHSKMLNEAEKFRRQLINSTDQNEREKLISIIKAYDGFFEGYPTVEDLRFPTLTFENALTFNGSERKAVLLTWGGAHSPCDACLWLEEEGILFLADLLVPKGNLILPGGGNPDNWLTILDQAEELGAKYLVPGHGEVIPAEKGFDWARSYLNNIFELTDKALACGKSEENVEEFSVPEGCNEYWFRENMRFLMNHRKK